MSTFNPQPKKFRPAKDKFYSIPKMSKKRQEKVKLEKEYYAQVIEDKKDKKTGKWYCEESGEEIKKPTGRNVSHVISKGANPALYLNPINCFLLTEKAHWQYEFGDRTTMKIYQKSEKIRIELTKEYYA